MGQRHILYVPWAYPSEGSEFHEKCISWRQDAANGDLSVGYNYEIVHYGDPVSFAKLPWGSEIYIRGHGAPGDHTIAEGGDTGPDLKYDVLAERLLSHGLKKTWVGVIKLYNCDSGRCTLGRQSFAAKFAQHMRFTEGYHLISYVGYLGAMDSRPVQNPGEKHKHKHFTLKTPFGSHEVKSKWGKAFF